MWTGWNCQIRIYVYGESNILYLTQDKKWLIIEKIALLAAVFFGAIFSADIVWTIGDIGNAAMAWVNIFALLIIGNLGIRIFQSFDKQKKQGIEEPSLDLKKLGIEEASAWDTEA